MTKFVVVLQPTVHSITLNASCCYGVPSVEHGPPVQKPTVFNIYPFWKKETLRFYQRKLNSSYSFFIHFCIKVTNTF